MGADAPFSCPWDHSWLMPVGPFHRNNRASQCGAGLEPSSPMPGRDREQAPSRAASICVRASGCALHQPQAAHTPSLPGSPPSLPFPFAGCPSASEPAQTPAVPGMKSRAAVAEKTTQQAGWHILRLRCLGGRLAAAPAAARGCRLPVLNSEQV